MRASRFLLHTLREAPADVDGGGYTMLLRGGYARPLGAGLFALAPLGLRVARHGDRRAFHMGSYGIGTERLLACIAEAHHDERGIAWPASVAPFAIEIVALDAARSPEVARVADELHAALVAAGIDVLLDDRDERAGVKFADADLVGAPVRVTVGARDVADGQVEVKRRTQREGRRIPLAGAAAALLADVAGAFPPAPDERGHGLAATTGQGP